jgi:hypothetical protein
MYNIQDILVSVLTTTVNFTACNYRGCTEKNRSKSLLSLFSYLKISRRWSGSEGKKTLYIYIYSDTHKAYKDIVKRRGHDLTKAISSVLHGTTDMNTAKHFSDLQMLKFYNYNIRKNLEIKFSFYRSGRLIDKYVKSRLEIIFSPWKERENR